MPVLRPSDLDRLIADLNSGLPADSALRRLAALQRKAALDMEHLRLTDHFLNEELGLSLDGELFANLSLVVCRQEQDYLARLETMPALARIHASLASSLNAACRTGLALQQARRAMAIEPLDAGLKTRLRALDGGDGGFRRAARDYSFSLEGYENELPCPKPWELVRFGDRIVVSDLELMALFSRPLAGEKWERSDVAFSYPFGLHDDGQGLLWVCDHMTNMLYCLDENMDKAGEYDLQRLLGKRFDDPRPFQVCRVRDRVFTGVADMRAWRFSLASFSLRDPAGTAVVYDDAEFGFLYRLVCWKNTLNVVRMDQRDFSRIPGNIVTRYTVKPNGVLALTGRHGFPQPVIQMLPMHGGFFILTFSSIIRTDAKLSTLFTIGLPLNSGGMRVGDTGFLCAPHGPVGGSLWFLDYHFSRIAAFQV